MSDLSRQQIILLDELSENQAKYVADMPHLEDCIIDAMNEYADYVLARANEFNKQPDTKALPLHGVSRWAYLYDNAKPLMIGFIAAMLLNTTYKLIETIIIKIALIVNGG